MTSAETSDLFEAMMTQRAIRSMKSDPVPEELIVKMIEGELEKHPSGFIMDGFPRNVAQAERKLISKRTKDALAAAKARGQKLGGFRGYVPTAEDGANGRKARGEKALEHAASLAPIIARLDPDGSLSLRALAAKLTAEGLPTPAGAAVWTAATVARLKAKLAAQGYQRQARANFTADPAASHLQQQGPAAQLHCRSPAGRSGRPCGR